MVSKNKILTEIDKILQTKGYNLTSVKIVDKCIKYEISYTYTNSNGEEITLELHEFKKNNKKSQKAFRDRLLEAYNYQMTDGWRVDAYEDNETPLPVENWDNTRMFVTKSGSTIAIRDDGDIISVCKNLSKIPSDNMKGVMQFATENGGTKLDSFGGNWGFYRACGFEPVSWIHFNEDYSPSGPNGWIKGTNLAEPIVFMKYTGKPYKLSASEVLEEERNFYRNVTPNTGENAYDDAYEIRDNDMK